MKFALGSIRTEWPNPGKDYAWYGRENCGWAENIDGAAGNQDYTRVIGEGIENKIK